MLFLPTTDHLEHPSAIPQIGDVELCGCDDDVEDQGNQEEVCSIALRWLDVYLKYEVPTEREHKLMPPSQALRDEAENNRKRKRDSPQREVVRVEEDKLESRPGRSEVVI
jgi:hypothetical protein